jgi:formamidopyrimidine-DNA glycosylase
VPELPEVETVRRGIDARVAGRRIGTVTIGRERSVRRVGKSAVIAGLSGALITGTRRRGKYIVCDLDNGGSVMIHLRMSGRVLVEPEGTERPPHTHVVLPLAPNAAYPLREEMWFVDPRTFGEVVVYPTAEESLIVPELARLGVDPIEDHFDAEIFRSIMKGRRSRVKGALLDQRLVTGLGNIYADEVLHRSGVRPTRTVDSLTKPTLNKMAGHIVEVLSAAIEAGGSTLDDTQYVDVLGNQGWFQFQHCVYGRTGETCPTCGVGVVKRTVVAGRSSHFCPLCQK